MEWGEKEKTCLDSTARSREQQDKENGSEILWILWKRRKRTTTTKKKKRLQTLGKWPRRNAILADKKKKEKVQENWRFFKETTMMALPKTIPKLAVILPFHMSLSDGGIDLQ